MQFWRELRARNAFDRCEADISPVRRAILRAMVSGIDAAYFSSLISGWSKPRKVSNLSGSPKARELLNQVDNRWNWNIFYVDHQSLKWPELKFSR